VKGFTPLLSMLRRETPAPASFELIDHFSGMWPRVAQDERSGRIVIRIGANVVLQMVESTFAGVRCVRHDDVCDAGGGADHLVAPTRIHPYCFKGDKVRTWWQISAMQETVAGRAYIGLRQIACDPDIGCKWVSVARRLDTKRGDCVISLADRWNMCRRWNS